MAGETILFPCQLLDILFALPSRCHLGGLPIHLEGLPNSSGVAPGYLFTSLLRLLGPWDTLAISPNNITSSPKLDFNLALPTHILGLARL